MINKQKIFIFCLQIIVFCFIIGNNQKAFAQTSQSFPKSEKGFIAAKSDSNTTLLGIWKNEIVKETNDLVVRDRYLYLLNKNKGLYILDISTPSNPVISDSCILSGYIGYLTINEGFAYVINDGIRIIDVNDPSNPNEVGHWSGPNGDDIVIKDDLAFITVGQSSKAYLYIIDVSDRSNPTEKGNYYAGTGDLDKLDVKGDYAYVGRDYLNEGTEFCFLTIDVSNPENPQEEGRYTGHWGFSSWGLGNRYYTDIFVTGTYLYATHQYGGFGVFDVSDPANPTEVSFYRGDMSSMSVEGDYAYVLDYDNVDCLRIINISNPSTPTLTGFYNIDALFQADITVQEGVAYIAADNLYIIQNNLITNIEDTDDFKPHNFVLEQNYPNPFNPVTTIQFSLKKDSHVQLEVYNTIGQKVATLVNEFYHAGLYKVNFDGSHLPSGIYIYKIQTKSFSESRKMMLMR